MATPLSSLDMKRFCGRPRSECLLCAGEYKIAMERQPIRLRTSCGLCTERSVKLVGGRLGVNSLQTRARVWRDGSESREAEGQLDRLGRQSGHFCRMRIRRAVISMRHVVDSENSEGDWAPGRGGGERTIDYGLAPSCLRTLIMSAAYVPAQGPGVWPRHCNSDAVIGEVWQGTLR